MDLPPKTALLPIDMQQAFDHAPWPRRWNRDLDRNGRALLAAWRGAGLPLIHVRHDSVQTGSSLRPGLPGHAYRPGFQPLPDEPVVAKSVNAAFIGTDLDLRLRRLGIEAIMAFGISTDMCVSTSVRVGANLGYRMIVVGDACDCFDLTGQAGQTIPAEAIHAAHLATLAYEFATVCTTEEALAAITSSAG
ncbi:cysteine hydrolase [Roseomonas hellenica]|uniref:Cysteine hydrolase n=1 Tax=Plastoroseomonas hellenica TaxID=2687306 RepID=A0ABS5ERW4_9PROT|nr:cysteine hydrolase family protein [Plastoroseomonas hellenica]MBR0662978.1 cysteine hydrolase [Plastoroseomonas hellenica]